MKINGLEISCSETSRKREVVTFFYKKEDQLFHSIHKRNGTVEENIQDSLDSISEDSVMYEVKVENEPAAFFVKYKDKYGRLALEGFHIGKEFRKGWFIEYFWKLVREKMEQSFLVGIYEKNERAINHLLKQSFKIVNRTEHDNKLFFIFKLN